MICAMIVMLLQTFFQLFLSFILIIHYGLYDVGGEVTSIVFAIIFMVLWVNEFSNFNGLAAGFSQPTYSAASRVSKFSARNPELELP